MHLTEIQTITQRITHPSTGKHLQTCGRNVLIMIALLKKLTEVKLSQLNADK